MSNDTNDSNTVVIEALKEAINELCAEVDELLEKMAVLETRGGNELSSAPADTSIARMEWLDDPQNSRRVLT